MRLLFTALFSFFLSFSFFGQGWEQIYNSINLSTGHAVRQTTDGGYIIGASSGLIKTDENGIVQWTNTFGGLGGSSVQQTTDGGYIIVGSTEIIPEDYDIYLIKTDGNGIMQWAKNFGEGGWDFGRSVKQTTDGGFIITGRLAPGWDESDVPLIKTDGNGIEQATLTFGGYPEYDDGSDVQQTTDGGYIIVGSTYSFGAGLADVFLVKTDGTGLEQWTQTFGGTYYDEGNSVQQTTDGGYIITGFTETFGTGVREVYLIKTDSNGNEQWSQTFGGIGWAQGNSVQQTFDGGYIIIGMKRYFNSDDEPAGGDIYLIKTDGNGNEQWSQTFGGGGNGFDVGSGQQTTDGGFIITGRTSGNDVYLIKTNSEGTLSSEFTIPTPSPRKLEKVVDALGREVNHTTNQILFYIYDDGSVEKKFIVE